jgi:hypothetical protein
MGMFQRRGGASLVLETLELPVIENGRKGQYL